MNDIRILFDGPWVIGGDFNTILFQSERNKHGGCLCSRNFFKKFMRHHSLIDLPLNGGKPSFVFAKKLQALKVLIKAWRKTLGDLQLQLDSLEEEIDDIDCIEEFSILNSDDIVQRENAKSKHAFVSLNLARKWGQRSKDRWSKDAERNSKYLHQLASFKYKLSNINCLNIDGELTYDKSKIAEEDTSFYSNLFSEQFPSRPRFDDLQMPSISLEDRIQLEKLFSEE
ncbi:uncharacterized protein LOC113334535 [Papaver somniferum]|uniref:uncharacterized protein LOC113334535 n=1 Tax=Papaver somniferum TaxID=3469 RepID=UPI000E7046C0|nr:uncharacterized protein LOC113334535 [Papaver somniferum]